MDPLILAFAAIASMAGTATTSASEVSEVSEASAGDEGWWSPLGLSVGLETVVGLGTFVANDKADDPYYASTIYLEPSWVLTEDVEVSASLDFTYEWTALVTPCHSASGPRPAGAPAEDCSDTADPNGRRAEIGDLELGISHASLISFFETKLSASTSLAFPTSRASRGAGNLLAWGIASGLSRSFGPITPRIGVSFRKFFPSDEAAVLDAGEVDAIASDFPIGRCASFRRTTCLLLSGFVPSWRFGADVSIGADIPWVEGLSTSVKLGYAYSRKFGSGGDAFSSTRTDADGDRIATGVNEDDTTSGSIEVAYAFDDHWSLAGGIASSQPAKTAGGKSLRFPFFDFISPANNYTGYYLYLSYDL